MIVAWALGLLLLCDSLLASAAKVDVSVAVG